MTQAYAPKALLFALLLLVPALCRAQDHWLGKFGGPQADHVADLVVDDADNSYVIGDFSLSMTAYLEGLSSGTLTSAGGRDIFLAKLAPDGSVVWWRRAGGTALDVGLKLALGPTGLAITGVFTGTVNLFGTTASAQGGSTDLFVALLDPATGATQWVRTAGSPGHTDTPGGITLSPSGSVVVAGKFKGSAVFGTDTLHSAFDPWTGTLGFDVFVASWSASGTLGWVKQGSGPHDDEAVDVVAGPDDMLYVTGQFSDTITFGQAYPNVSLNSIFLLKLDAQGNDQWFRRCGGSTYNRVSGLRFSSAGGLLLTGDVANNMFWVGGTATPIPNTYPHAYFILRVGTSGTLLGATTMGSQSPVHAAAITEQADSVVVYGEFECSFTGLQAAYGANGLFMATGLKDLFISKYLASDLTFVEAQQFGGAGAKRAGSIATVQDELLFCGSFEQHLFLPRSDPSWGDPAWSFPACSYLGSNAGLTYCDDPVYGYFAWGVGQGLADGFLTKGYEENRAPYDFWQRQNTPPCTRTDRSGEVHINALGLQDPDSVSACGQVTLYSVVPFPRRDWQDPFCLNAPTVGPFQQQMWSNGWPNNETTAYSTGWYHFNVYSTNGCWNWHDSIHVTINAVPSARVSDSSGVFVNIFLPQVYQSCDTMVIWASQYEPTDVVYWTVGADTTWSDTIRTTHSAVYRLHVVSANGCHMVYPMNFTLLAALPWPNITGVVSYFTQGDTTSSCSATCGLGAITNIWYVDGMPAQLPQGLKLTYQFGQGTCNSPNGPPPAQTTPYINSPVAWNIPINGPGWYHVTVEFTLHDLPCGTHAYPFTFSDSIYVIPGQPPQFTASNVFRCVGDTVAIPFACTACDSVSWSGPGIVWTSATGDSIRVDQNGYYYFTVYNTVHGNTCQSSSYRTVSAPPPPPIYMSPYHGVICPGDSVRLYTTTVGIGYEWTGPGMMVLPDAASIWVDEPGDYYLTVTHYPGCTSTNGPRTVLSFSSPFIEALPTGVICLNGSVELHVVSGPGSTVHWQPPLSGNSFTHAVTSPGTYQCVVSSCGIDWTLSYTVTASTVDAEPDTTAYLLCGNAPLVLDGPPGAAIYQWLPAGGIGQQLVVTEPGEYWLVVVDPFGCSDTSSTITVLAHTITEPVTAVGDTVCAGSPAVLSAGGSGDLFWYAAQDTSALLGTGNTWTFQPTATDTLYVLQVEDGCPGVFVPVVAQVAEAPVAPQVAGGGVYCAGEELLLTATVPGQVVIAWATPVGPVQGPVVGPLPADGSLTGMYSCWAVGAFCNSDTAHLPVVVHPVPEAPWITGDTLLCIGDTLVLAVLEGTGAVVWATPAGPVFADTVWIPGVQAGDAGWYACHTAIGPCRSDTVLVRVVLGDCPTDDEDGDVVIPNVITPNGDGVNDVFLIASEHLERIDLSIYNRWGQLVAQLNGRIIRWDGRATFSGMLLSDGVYYYVMEAVTSSGTALQRTGYVHLRR